MICDKFGNELKKGDIIVYGDSNSAELGIMIKVEGDLSFFKSLNPVKGSKTLFFALGIERRFRFDIIKIERAKFLIKKNKRLYVVIDDIENALGILGGIDDIIELDGNTLKDNPEYLF